MDDQDYYCKIPKAINIWDCRSNKMLGSLKHSVVGISEANGCLGLLEQWIFRIAKAVGYWDGQSN